MSEQVNYLTQERAEQYGKEKLEQILEYLEKRGLENITPYNQFQELLDCLKKKRQLTITTKKQAP